MLTITEAALLWAVGYGVPLDAIPTELAPTLRSLIERGLLTLEER